MLDINFKNIKNTKLNNNDITKIYKGNILLWELSKKLKYPFNLMDSDLKDFSFLDIDSSKLDYNIFLLTLLKLTKTEYYRDYDFEIMKGFVGNELFKSKNIMAGAKYFNNAQQGSNDWNIKTGWVKDTEKFMGNDVYKYTGANNYITKPVNIGNYVGSQYDKKFTFSFYAKSDKYNVPANIFISNDTGGTSDIASNNNKSITLSTEWQRYDITFTLKKLYGQIYPNVQLPNNSDTIYISSYMLNEGDKPLEWDNGFEILTSKYEELLNVLYDNFDKFISTTKEKYLIYRASTIKDLDKKIIPYIKKLNNELYNDKIDILIDKIHNFSYDSQPEVSVDKTKFKFSKEFEPKTEYVKNTEIGYAPYSRSGEYSEDISMVYMDMRWNEVEKVKDVYDWENWERLTRWKLINSMENVNIVFRLILDEPTDVKHSDLPDYLTTTTYGQYYDNEYGKGFAPYYDNRELIDRFKAFISSFLDRYTNYSYNTLGKISIIQFGIFGHWGEWYNHPTLHKFPNSDILKEYLDLFVSKLNYTTFLFRRNFKFIEDYKKQYPNNYYGVYNDVIGDKNGTEEWLNWINNGSDYPMIPNGNGFLPAMPTLLENTLVGGELTSGIPMKELLVDKLDQTVDLIKKSHISVMGQKIPIKEGDISEEQFKNAYEKIRDLLGYKVYIKNINIDFSGDTDNLQGNVSVSVTIKNMGNSALAGSYQLDIGLISPSDSNQFYGSYEGLIGSFYFKDLGAGEERVLTINNGYFANNVYGMYLLNDTNTLRDEVFYVRLFNSIIQDYKSINLYNKGYTFRYFGDSVDVSLLISK